MLRIALAAALSLALGAAARAQPVEVQALAAPDAFSTPGRDAGLGADLWRGSSIATAQAVLPILAARPLSPAFAEVARRVLATGAQGPAGATDDAGLAGARINALIALGDLPAASRILQRAPSLDKAPELARAVAEASLLAGDEARACAVGDGLTLGRDDIYWLRLRAYCLALAGKTEQAQLTLDLAQDQVRDAVYGRLMTAKLGGGPPGAASLRNGLDYALSKELGLDLAAARPAPAVAAALSGASAAAPVFDLVALDAGTAGLASAIPRGPLPVSGVTALIGVAAEANAASRARLQGAALLAAALVPQVPDADRVRIAGFAVGPGKASAGRSLAFEDAVARRLKGETALLALWIAADAGVAGPDIGDRVRIVRGFTVVGLTAEAQLVALEGLAGLK